MRTEAEVMYILSRSKKYNWTYKEIAQLFGCNISTVCRHIEPERWARWEIVLSARKLRSLYKKLRSIKKVAAACMCGEETIRRKLHEYKIPVRSQGKPPKKIRVSVMEGAG